MAVWNNFEEATTWTNDPKIVLNCKSVNVDDWNFFENEWWVKQINKKKVELSIDCGLGLYSEEEQNLSHGCQVPAMVSQTEYKGGCVDNWQYWENEWWDISSDRNEWWVNSFDTVDRNEIPVSLPTTMNLKPAEQHSSALHVPNVEAPFYSQCENQNDNCTPNESKTRDVNTNIETSSTFEDTCCNLLSIVPVFGIIGYYYGRYMKNLHERPHKDDLHGLDNYEFWYEPETYIQNQNPNLACVIGPFTYSYVLEYINSGYFENTKFYCSIGLDMICNDYVSTTDFVEYELSTLQRECHRSNFV